MKNITQKILKYSWMILENKDGSYMFNVYNPLAYIALIIVAVIFGVSAAMKEGYNLIKHTFSSSVTYGSQWPVVFFNVVLLIYIAYSWLS